MGIFTRCQSGERGVKLFTYGKIESPHLREAYSRREDDSCGIHEKEIRITKPAGRFGRGGSHMFHVNPLVFLNLGNLQWSASRRCDFKNYSDCSPSTPHFAWSA